MGLVQLAGSKVCAQQIWQEGSKMSIWLVQQTIIYMASTENLAQVLYGQYIWRQ